MSASAAFVVVFDPGSVQLDGFAPTATVDIVVTNTGPVADDLGFFTINMTPLSGSTDITVDPPATVSHFGVPFFGGGGLPAGDSAIIGSFSFTLDPGTTATVEAPISTVFGGTMFYQATSAPDVVPVPVSYTVTAVPEAGSSVLIATFLGLGLLRRRR